jgi:hypothetical protein
MRTDGAPRAEGGTGSAASVLEQRAAGWAVYLPLTCKRDCRLPSPLAGWLGVGPASRLPCNPAPACLV